MQTHEKQFTLFTNLLGANALKVAIVLEELGLTYEPLYLSAFAQDDSGIKGPLHTRYNPNGRIPTLVDHHNGDFVIWESNAILTYLVERYDPEHKLSVADADEKFIQLQWLFFQGTGQGPYFGQAGWFMEWHPDKVQSVIERYQNEIIRVFSVLESVLSGREWLVGGKCTIADLSFVPFDVYAIEKYVKGYKGFDFEKDFPSTYRKRPSESKPLRYSH